MALLQSLWQDSDLAYVFITHDLRIVRHLVDRIAVMYLGRVVETGNIRSVYERPRHPYTRALLDPVPTMDPSVRNLPPPLQGEIDASKASEGCVFRTRCPFAIDRCASETPRLREFDCQQVACHRAEDVSPEVCRKEIAQ